MRIYLLCDNSGRCEVEEFLLGRTDRAAVDGMLAVLDRIEERGTGDLPSAVFKQFQPKKTKERLSQISKGSFRILGFVYGERRCLLLATVFRKRSDVARDEYDRALKKKRLFDEAPDWRD